MPKKRKISLKHAVKELTAIAEEHLASYHEEERDARVAAFSRAKITSGRGGTHSKSSLTSHKRESRVAARGR